MSWKVFADWLRLMLSDPIMIKAAFAAMAVVGVSTGLLLYFLWPRKK